jgi:hypothetical protein
MTQRPRSWAFLASAILLLSALCGPGAKGQAPRRPSFLADKYEVSVYVDTAAQGINAIAKVEFRAHEVSSNVVVELHENLEVREIRSAEGKSLTFQRESENPLFLMVNLPAPVAVGQATTLTFNYGGLLANEENSPVPNVRVASVNKDWSYLLLPARWFPLTNYPSNRYTATFKLNVPDTVAVAGTGKAEAPQPMAPRSAAEGGRLMYTFRCERLIRDRPTAAESKTGRGNQCGGLCPARDVREGAGIC